MKNLKEIEFVMTRMIELLRAGGGDEWAGAFERLKGDLLINSGDVLFKIISMYGGMGSLNDVVLYEGGQPMISENNEFDKLREKLYFLCQR
ncbi:DUF6966 domain-containing protein [Chitiniphilus shinanonensis]|uniref:DUF6966 domain-containing protein n=1 Tax=Chitiniphilus shinanonensis TaxID=553088 RepID=UPI0003A6E6BF|nr:hypothetical protein [Chitiniphilus shinanonensis]